MQPFAVLFLVPFQRKLSHTERVFTFPAQSSWHLGLCCLQLLKSLWVSFTFPSRSTVVHSYVRQGISPATNQYSVLLFLSQLILAGSSCLHLLSRQFSDFSGEQRPYYRLLAEYFYRELFCIVGVHVITEFPRDGTVYSGRVAVCQCLHEKGLKHPC